MKRFDELDKQIHAEEEINAKKKLAISPFLLGIIFVAVLVVSFVFIKLFVPAKKDMAIQASSQQNGTPTFTVDFGDMWKDPALPENAFSIVDAHIEQYSHSKDYYSFSYTIRNNTDIDMTYLGIMCSVQDADGNICGDASAHLNTTLPAGKQGILEGSYQRKTDKACLIIPESINYDTDGDSWVITYKLSDDVIKTGILKF